MGIAKQLLGLGGWLFVTFAAGAFGALASTGSEEFYRQLVRPDWAPPPSLFGPVWSVLYVLMAVSAWLVWRAARRGENTRPALLLFLLQLFFNGLWTWLFFGFRDGPGAFAEILILWVLLFATVVAFWRILPAAGALLLPYLGWVTFAAALTYAIWQSNPRLLS
jgi:tryptophan-rich sensory protein